MSLRGQIAKWPLAWKAPLLAAGLVIAVAVVISQVVLSRLESDQDENLHSLTSAYLDGLSAAVLPAMARADIWETFDALDRARNHYRGLKVRFALVTTPNGRVLAASDPLHYPVLREVPAELQARVSDRRALVADTQTGRAWVNRTLSEEGYVEGRILAEIDISDLLRVRRRILLTLIAVNAALALGFAAIGFYSTKRMLRPLGVLSSHMERVRAGKADPIPDSGRRRLSWEFDRLYDQFNAMAQAVNEREALATRIAAQERFAVLGKLASGMAHEVNNPLGGLFNAVDTLRRHGDDAKVREAALSLLNRGLTSIRDVVATSLVTYRRGPTRQSLRAVDVDDLRLLIEPETRRKRITVLWRNEIVLSPPVVADSVRQASLNLLINACAACRAEGVIRLRAFATGDALVVEVSDQGPGLPADVIEYLTQGAERPPRLTGGLGLWSVRRLVTDAGGRIAIEPSEDFATTVRVYWPFGGASSSGPSTARSLQAAEETNA